MDLTLLIKKNDMIYIGKNLRGDENKIAIKYPNVAI